MKSVTRRGMTRGFLLLLVVSTIAMVPQKASATDQLLMHVPGIPGSSATRADWIDLFSFSGTAVAPASNGIAKITPIVYSALPDHCLKATRHSWTAFVGRDGDRTNL